MRAGPLVVTGLGGVYLVADLLRCVGHCLGEVGVRVVDRLQLVVTTVGPRLREGVVRVLLGLVDVAGQRGAENGGLVGAES